MGLVQTTRIVAADGPDNVTDLARVTLKFKELKWRGMALNE